MPQRFPKTFGHECKYYYICRQLKYHQHRIKSKTSISFEIILNVFKGLIVALVPLKFSSISVYFSWRPL